MRRADEQHIGVVAKNDGAVRRFEIRANWLTPLQQELFDTFVRHDPGGPLEGLTPEEVETWGRPLEGLQIDYCGRCGVRLDELIAGQIEAFDALARSQNGPHEG